MFSFNSDNNTLNNQHELEYLKIINDDLNGHNNDDLIIHIVPMVPEIVKFCDISNQVVFLSPPEGLLELGYEKQNMKLLSNFNFYLNLIVRLKVGDELMEYCKVEEILHKKVYSMPSARRLAESGRPDLIKKIKTYGGFLYVANMLGWKAIRKPSGPFILTLPNNHIEII